MYTGPGHGKVDPEQNVHDKLDKEVDQAGQYLADGGGKPWEIHLAEHLAVGHKGVGRAVDAGGKKGPHRIACHVEQKAWCAVRGKACNAAEHHVEQHRGDKRVQDDPQRPQDGLLVHDGKVALDEHDDQVTVAPQFFQVHIKPAGARPNNGGPLRIIPGRGLVALLCHKKPFQK